MILYNCSVGKNFNEHVSYENPLFKKAGTPIQIDFMNGKAFNHPTYVLWEEDLQGRLLRTHFITQSYATGIFGHQMVGDSVWLRTSGESYQPAALPYWTHKKGKIGSGDIIPTPDNPYVDGFSGATPLGNLSLHTSLSGDQPVRLFLEVNQPWDWNSYWTNNKFPDNDPYKHAAQPSLVYSVTIDGSQQNYYMNPVGHGDPKGETGLLFTDLRTMTTARDIFESISIKILN